MDSYLNTNRPLVYCPGCTHTTVTKKLDAALRTMGFPADKTVIVSDIGCSGLFDTFFNVHAVHGIHGRALTYATGLKLANPELTVIVTMGDGGLGIGGAHVLSACRKNLDITLLILNNFNFGMTGGQFSSTTPSDAQVGSEFLNQAEIPVDICAVAVSAGASYVARCSALAKNLDDEIVKAVRHRGFSLVETLGICTGRYTRRNPLNPAQLEEKVATPNRPPGLIPENQRPEYGSKYRKLAASAPQVVPPVRIEQCVTPPQKSGKGVAILGSAGMRIITAGEILCHAAMAAGFSVSLKSDYDITVLRGPSVSEIILSPEHIGYAGLVSPDVILALSDEGVKRRQQVFAKLPENALILRASDVELPENKATVIDVNFKPLKLRKEEWAICALAMLGERDILLNRPMLEHGLKTLFPEKIYRASLKLVETVSPRHRTQKIGAIEKRDK